MTTSLLLAVLSAVGGPPSLQPDASVEVLARARTDGDQGSPAAILELRPSARLLVTTPALRLSAAYRLRAFAGVAPGPQLTGLQHAAEAAATFDLARGTALTVLQRAGYGYEDFGHVEYGARAWAIEARPLPIASWATLQSEASLSLQPHRRLAATLSAGYAVNGALDRAEQDRLPLQRGPYLSGWGAWSLSRNASLITQLWSSWSLITGGRSAGVVRLSEVWRHDWSRLTRTELGAGLGALTRTRGGEPDQTGLLPVLQAAVRQRIRVGRKDGALSAEARMQPYLSLLSTQAYQRAEVMASAQLPLIERAQLRMRAGAASEVFAAAAPEQILLGDLELQYPVTNALTLAAGGLAAWQQVPQLAIAPTFQWSVYVSFVAWSDDRAKDRR